MRRWLLAALVALPLSAQAVDAPPRQWTDCADDTQCVVVKGICNPAAVNVGYKGAAASYFAEQAKTAKCVTKFWMPTEEGSDARCRLERCELVGKEPTK